MTQDVTSGDMFVNFGKCLQTFSNWENIRRGILLQSITTAGIIQGVVTIETVMTFILKNPILGMCS